MASRQTAERTTRAIPAWKNPFPSSMPLGRTSEARGKLLFLVVPNDRHGPQVDARRTAPKDSESIRAGQESSSEVPCTVVVIEDDPLTRTALGESLGRQGFAIILAPTATEGLRAVRSGKADVVLLDLGLPDIDGIDVLRALKRSTLTRRIPVVVLTAVGTIENREQAFRHGCDAFVAKPPQLDDLASTLRIMHSKHRSEHGRAPDANP